MIYGMIVFLPLLWTTVCNAWPPQWPKPHRIDWPAQETWPGWPKPSLYTPEQPTATTWPKQHPGKPSVTPSLTTQPTPPSYTSPTTTPSSYASDNACDSIRILQASTTSTTPKATATVPAQLAYECVNSVPFNSSAAVALMDSIRPYLDWQTTIQWLKDPPAEYAEKIQPPYDFYAEFKRIYSKASANDYSNEYSFGNDLYTAFQAAHDGHFAIYPDSFTGVFSYGRTTPLVSVSLDGKSIPQVYVYQDVLSSVVENATFTPSPLVEIDGQNSTDYLLRWASYGSLQDPDALWNNMFYLLQQVSLGSGGTGTGTFAGGGRGRWMYPGPSTTLTFANGTSITSENFARVLVSFENITSGPDIYKEFFTPTPSDIESAEALATSTTSSASSTSTSASSTMSTVIPAPGYPTPVVREMSNLNSGYFLEGAGYDDVAVLSIASFVSSDADEMSFQEVNTYLLDQAVAKNKTKLIIDVSANGGGTILQGYDVFKQLFPQILPYGASRFRAHEAFDLIGQEISHFSGLVPRNLTTLNDTAADLVSSTFNYRTDADVDYEPFTSWPDKFGPQTFGPGPDNYTNIVRWNLSDVLTPLNSGGIVVSGYLNRTNVTMQPFKAEDIVVVTDGYCASTCTIFSELLRQQAGVKFVNLGGRPNKAITQAIGGVKGTNDYPYADILGLAEVPFQYRYIHDAAFYNQSALGAYNDLVLYRTVKSVVNSRDGFRENDPSNVPLQFQYEAADCRLYYTPEMAVDQTATWKTVADVAFNGVEGCVAGSLGSSGGGYGGGKNGYEKKKERWPVGKQHAVRRDMNLEEHFTAIKETWTEKNGIVPGGDGYMVL